MNKGKQRYVKRIKHIKHIKKLLLEDIPEVNNKNSGKLKLNYKRLKNERYIALSTGN